LTVAADAPPFANVISASSESEAFSIGIYNFLTGPGAPATQSEAIRIVNTTAIEIRDEWLRRFVMNLLMVQPTRAQSIAPR
jgi:hypothetical protein